MIIRMCDACGKQINRYDKSYSCRYDIRATISLKDADGEIHGVGLTNLDFCPECYAKIEAGINAVMKNLPSEFNAIVRRDQVME